jgi:hypothetical protein
MLYLQRLAEPKCNPARMQIQTYKKKVFEMSFYGIKFIFFIMIQRKNGHDDLQMECHFLM